MGREGALALAGGIHFFGFTFCLSLLQLPAAPVCILETAFPRGKWRRQGSAGRPSLREPKLPKVLGTSLETITINSLNTVEGEKERRGERRGEVKSIQ